MKKKAREYKYPQIIIQMALNGDTISDLVRKMGITRQALYLKLEGKSPLKMNEIEFFCNYYKKGFDELFKEGE